MDDPWAVYIFLIPPGIAVILRVGNAVLGTVVSVRRVVGDVCVVCLCPVLAAPRGVICKHVSHCPLKLHTSAGYTPRAEETLAGNRNVARVMVSVCFSTKRGCS